MHKNRKPAAVATPSFLLRLKSLFCFKSTSWSHNVDQASKKKISQQNCFIHQYTKESVVPRSKSGDQMGSTKTLGEWIIASPAPLRQRQYYAPSKKVNPWVPHAKCSSIGDIAKAGTVDSTEGRVLHETNNVICDSKFYGARDSICIEKERRLVVVQGISLVDAAGDIDEPRRTNEAAGSSIIKTKKTVTFRFPDEADIIFFSSPPRYDDIPYAK